MVIVASINIAGWTEQSTSPIKDGNYPSSARPSTTPVTGIVGMPSAYADFTHYSNLNGGDIFPWTVDINGKYYTAANDVNASTGIYSGAAWVATLEANGTLPGGLTFTEKHRTHRDNSYSCANSNPANNCPPVGKINSLLAIGTDLYIILQDQGAGVTGGSWARSKIGKSTDGGVSWTFNSGFSSADADWDIIDHVFNNGGICQFGKGYSNVPAAYKNGSTAYIYLFDADAGETDSKLYMARVPENSFQSLSTWEYWDGTAWTSTKANKAAIIDAANFTGVTKLRWASSMTYIPVLNRFVYMAQVNDTNTIALFEAENPWGTWSLVSTYVIDSSGEKISPQILPDGASLSTTKNPDGTVDCIFKLGGYTGSGTDNWDTLHLASVKLST